MPQAVTPDISHAAGIVTTKSSCAITYRLLALGFGRDDGAENDAADDACRNRTAIAATPVPASATPVLHLNDQGIIVGLRLRR